MNNLNYGVIGNCRTAALISQNGNIEWLCFPDFDSPSIFASMLDREKGGAFGFEVSGDYRITQNYVPHTNILSTQFSSDEGEFVVLDYMPCYRSQDETGHYLPAELYRYIHWIKGNIYMLPCLFRTSKRKKKSFLRKTNFSCSPITRK